MHFFSFLCIFLFDMGVGASSLVRYTNLTTKKLQTNYHAFETNHDVVGVFFQALQTPLETSWLSNVANISNMGQGCTLVLSQPHFGRVWG
jgi:hypothetical protein